LPESLVGTGFRGSELLDWLRAIPDGAGTEELLRRLDDYARANAYRPVEVRWRKEPARPAHRYERQRWWPTQSLLDAGTDLLMEEWDPFGVRLAGVDREAVAMFVFHFFRPLLAPNERIDPITHTTEMIASAERDHLALNPSPEPHRRYLARRLAELVERYPVPNPIIRHASGVVVISTESTGPPASPALDPEGVCARCHAFGTVARVTSSNPTRHTRFCAACWREVRSSYVSHEAPRPPRTAREQIAFMDRGQELPRFVDSRSWDDTIDNVRWIRTALDDPNKAAEITPAMLAEWAAGIGAHADKMDGPMPPEIETFVREFAKP
jgi:hypothetical protein